MSLKSKQTRILTQAAGSTVVLAVSVRVWDVTRPDVPVQIGSVQANMAPDAVIQVSPFNPDILFISDGTNSRTLYAVSVTEPRAPRVISQVHIT